MKITVEDAEQKVQNVFSNKAVEVYKASSLVAALEESMTTPIYSCEGHILFARTLTKCSAGDPGQNHSKKLH